jgi:CRISPR/Cas system-associated exonuclease Cas4 (RecB family)
MLTKSAYLAFLQCPKHFWLNEHQQGLAAPPDMAARRRMRVGIEAENSARGLFPDGIHIPYRPHPADMAPLTAEAIANSAQTLLQGTFAVDDLLVKTDILSRTETGWQLIEVKSTTSVKEDEHLPDIAFQMYVLEKAGLEVTQASIMHPNRECRYPDLTNLFTLTDVFEQAASLLPSIDTDIIKIREIQRQPAQPAVGIGRHCTRPRVCSFFEHCWRDVEGLTIYDIPRLNQEKEAQLQAKGVLYLNEIPPDFLLSANQRSFVEFITQEQINIDRAAIQGALDSLTYPLYFFDFETIEHAIPIYAGCGPYQQVPFQYSCHVLQAEGSLTHHEYLHTQADDPRPALVETMLKDLGTTGQIIAYYAPFERGILQGLAETLPNYQEQLLALEDRLWDQLDIFKRFYRHHGFGKSNSLKSVLPVIVPELSYDSLDIQDGGQAQVAWEQMITCENINEKEQLVEQLRVYCHLDTLAMVKMHQVLTKL